MSKTKPSALVAVAFLLSMLVASLGATNHTSADSSNQPQFINGKIAYIQLTPSNNSIQMRNGDGSDPVTIYTCSGLLGSPTWSPNGKQLLFSSACQTPSYADIYRINAAGTGMTNLTNTPTTREETPAWSPDGTKIAYISDKNRSIADYRLWIMNADGSGATDISDLSSQLDRFPTWSPDGKKIYYSSQRSSVEQLYVYDTTTHSSSQFYAYPNNNIAYQPSVSPDGAKVLFAYVGSGDSKVQVYTQNVNGSDLKKPYQPCTDEDSQWPTWSPDGKKIAYITGCDKIFDQWSNNSHKIHVMNADGTADKAITGDYHDNSYNNGQISWQRLPVNSSTDNPKTGRTEHEQDDDHHDTDYEVDGGNDLIVNGSVGTVIVHGDGILKGHGAVADLNVANQGHLAPGNSPGCISTNNLTLATGSTLDEEVGGTTKCSDYDQTSVTGTVTINNATLNTTLYGGFVPSVGNAYTIIDNDGSDAVTGTLNNLAEGATFTTQGVTYKITYVGGDGNDVVLTVSAVDSAVAATASKAPNTGLKLLAANPLLALVVTVFAAGTLLGIARQTKP
jgi:hypothetical protein